jgi:uncharacterized protein YcbX
VSAIVLELWRYPVKSLLGEAVELVEVDERGVRGDRLFAVTDRAGRVGSGKTTRRFRRLDGLFDLRARSDDGRVFVTLPNGRELAVGDSRLNQFLSERYREELRVLEESTVPHHDAAPLHLLTTASLRWLQAHLPPSIIDRRRFRPNILLDEAGDDVVEDGWVGRRFALGDAVIQIVGRTERCVMTTNPQEELPMDSAVLRSVTRRNDLCLGVYAMVEQPGAVRAGDALLAID